MARSPWRLAAPAIAALLLPVVVEVVVWLAAPERSPFGEPGVLAFNAVWAAVPFALVGGIAAAKPAVRPAFGTAAIVGLALTAAAWVWVAWDGIRAVTGQSTGGANIGLGIVLLAMPIVVLSVMVTVLAVRGAFGTRPRE